MSIKTVRKFETLRSAWLDAKAAREASAKATQDLSGPEGGAPSLSALGSKAGAKAAVAEVAALREERRALKRLAAYAVRHKDAVSPAKQAAGKQAAADGPKPKAAKPARTAKPGSAGGKRPVKRDATGSEA